MQAPHTLALAKVYKRGAHLAFFICPDTNIS
ncbi:hypothetical protein [Bacillus phage vB_BceS-M2]